MKGGNKMKLFAPGYYKNFKCIADRCNHSCCIGWEIDIDEKTLALYERCGGILATVEQDGTPHFRLTGDRCPHLNENGLCNIIIGQGDGWLSDICREHPRFYNETSRGREVGLGMSCEEAARIILEHENYADVQEIGIVDEVGIDSEFDTVAERERIYKKLSDTAVPYGERIAGFWSKYGASPEILTDEEWRGIISELEFLNEEHRELFACYSSDGKSPEACEKILERFLAYLIYRHASSAKTESRFRAALGFAFFTERLLASLIKKLQPQSKNDIYEIARVISEEIEYSEENTEAITLEFEFC